MKPSERRRPAGPAPGRAPLGYEQHRTIGARVAEARRACGGPVAMAEEFRWYRD